MDSGIDFDHPDLKANMWTNAQEVPGNGLDDDGNGYVDDVHGINTFTVGGGTVADDFFHGTHLAGIVGASCNNRIGTCGVSPVVRLMGCKFLDGSGNGYTSDAVRCLNYAITMGADVTLNSYGEGCFSFFAVFLVLGREGARAMMRERERKREREREREKEKKNSPFLSLRKSKNKKIQKIGGLAADSQALRAAISAAGVAGQLFVAAAGNDYGTNIDLKGGTPTFPVREEGFFFFDLFFFIRGSRKKKIS